MFSTQSTMAAPLASIRSTLERHTSLTNGYLPPHTPSGLPLFDANAPLRTSVGGSATDYASYISSLDLPAPLASDVISIIAQESERYRTFIEQVRVRQLRELSTTSVTPDPSSIPSLVEAACNTFHNLLIKSGLQEIEQRLSSLGSCSDGAGSDVDQSGSDSDSDTSSESDDGGEEGFDQPDDDDNAPIRPGEDVPPLETKFLPIFEALHERGKVLTKPEKTYLVNMTGMTYRQITIWFQNRRRGELKESMNVSATYSRASSTHSDELSDFSENELEKQIAGSHIPDSTFDIRSWRLKSALATNNNTNAPPSPFKPNFPQGVDNPDTPSDESDLSDDSDNETDLPSGSQAPSLCTSMTSIDSVSAGGASGHMVTGSFLGAPAMVQRQPMKPLEPVHSRPIRKLPMSRLGTPPGSRQHALVQAPPGLYESAAPVASPKLAHDVPQFISSNEQGLTLNLTTSPSLQATTLRSSVSALPMPGNLSVSTPPTALSSPSPASTESPQRQSSPTLSGHSTSPRPQAKPLPRRTGCAPRPRPPPRSGSTSMPTTALGSSRPSVVLPPSSNPSLSNTTLGTLLRPNQPAPIIPAEIEERLTAMTGRMGVGASSNPRKQTASIPQAPSRGGMAVGASVLPGPAVSFSFGPTSLPNTKL